VGCSLLEYGVCVTRYRAGIQGEPTDFTHIMQKVLQESTEKPDGNPCGNVLCSEFSLNFIDAGAWPGSRILVEDSFFEISYLWEPRLDAAI